MPTRPTPKPRPRPSAVSRPTVDCDAVRAKADELRTHGRHCELIADLFLAVMGCEDKHDVKEPAGGPHPM